MIQYAVNVADLHGETLSSPGAKIAIQCMMPEAIRAGVTVNAEEGCVDGKALSLSAVYDEARAKAIVEVLRLKFGKSELRCYEQGPRARKWRRV